MKPDMVGVIDMIHFVLPTYIEDEVRKLYSCEKGNEKIGGMRKMLRDGENVLVFGTGRITSKEAHSLVEKIPNLEFYENELPKNITQIEIDFLKGER